MTTVTATVPDALADLARRWNDIGEADREQAFSSLICPSLTGIERADRWAEYIDAVLRADDLVDGFIDWRDFAPDYDTALFAVCGDQDAALKRLINGTAPGRGDGGN